MMMSSMPPSGAQLLWDAQQQRPAYPQFLAAPLSAAPQELGSRLTEAVGTPKERVPTVLQVTGRSEKSENAEINGEYQLVGFRHGKALDAQKDPSFFWAGLSSRCDISCIIISNVCAIASFTCFIWAGSGGGTQESEAAIFLT